MPSIGWAGFEVMVAKLGYLGATIDDVGKRNGLAVFHYVQYEMKCNDSEVLYYMRKR
jgi:hypothetical protein